MPLAHIGLPTGQHFKIMRDFYVKALAPLGYTIYREQDGLYLGMGPPRGVPDFWLHANGPNEKIEKFDGNLEKRVGKTHVCFEVSSTKEVDKWYEAAV
jgi:catechol 2,3-dioxygenase-like lactoylglutathione lyase family enzyme